MTDPSGVLGTPDAHGRVHSPENGDLAAVTTAWTDGWWDPEVGLVWMPPDPVPGIDAPPPPGLHLLPQTAWYAAALLLRDGAGDHDRAIQALTAVLDHQYDAPGTVWHGTFSQFHESPEPRDGAVMWVDYDPNWRQFIGCTLLLILRRFGPGLPAALVERIDGALRLAVEGEPDRRITDNYSNIALMHAYLEVEAGTRMDEPAWVASGEDRARRVVAIYDQFGAFEEYNSPTYYGIDLKALGLWRGHSSSPVLTELGTRVEAALWTDAVRWYHHGLGNVAGPYTRAYGMDFGAYVAAWAMWIWAAVGPDDTPVPPLDARLDHGLDFMLGGMVALIGVAVPPAALAHLTGFSGERLVEQRISDADHGDRVAAAWLGPHSMVGAETNAVDLSWWDQFHAATAHWRRPDGSVGWIRAVVPGASDTTVEPRRLTLRWHHDSEAGTARFVLDRPGDLDGATITTDGPPLRADGATLVAPPRTDAPTTTFTIDV